MTRGEDNDRGVAMNKRQRKKERQHKAATAMLQRGTFSSGRLPFSGIDHAAAPFRWDGTIDVDQLLTNMGGEGLRGTVNRLRDRIARVMIDPPFQRAVTQGPVQRVVGGIERLRDMARRAGKMVRAVSNTGRAIELGPNGQDVIDVEPVDPKKGIP